MFVVGIVGERPHHVLLRGAVVTHLAGLAVGVALYGLEHLRAAAHVEYAAYLVE